MTPSSGPRDGLLVTGRIGRPQGVRGEVTVEVRTDDPDTRFAVGSVLRTEPAERGPLTVSAVRWHSGRLMLSLEGVEDRSRAEELRDTLLVIDVADIPPPDDADDPDDFHDTHLVGLRAELDDGTPVGDVVDVVHLPHGDLLAVDRPGLPQVLVPFVRAFVPVVDVRGGRLVLTPPEGLLDLDPARALEPGTDGL